MSTRTRSRKAPARGVTVRPASAKDVETIVRLRMALLREQSDHPVYGRLRADAIARARRSTALHIASGREITWLAVSRNVVIGMLRCIDARGSPLLHPERYGYIASVYVRPAHRRRGVLRRLVDAAVVWCRARGLAELRVHATTDSRDANATWEALGFPQVEVLRRRVIARTPGAR